MGSKSGRTAELWRERVLAQQASGSGFWYAGAGHQLRGRGQALQWTVGQAQPLACLVVGP